MILYYTDNLFAQAKQLVSGMSGFSLQQVDKSNEINQNGFECRLDITGLSILIPLFPPSNIHKFYSQFIRRRKVNLARETLLQAINLRSNFNQPLSVLDLTAGLGRDAILMALAGFKVTMVERNPYLALILKYLVTTFAIELPNLSFIYANGQQFLTIEQQQYAIVYLDPMFMDNKSAKSKKDLQLIEYLIGQDVKYLEDESLELFNLAKKCCTNRIVVKRDNKQAQLIAAVKPTYSKNGKTVRFDVYQISVIPQENKNVVISMPRS